MRTGAEFGERPGVQPKTLSWAAMPAELGQYQAKLSWLLAIPGIGFVPAGLRDFLPGDAFEERGQA